MEEYGRQAVHIVDCDNHGVFWDVTLCSDDFSNCGLFPPQSNPGQLTLRYMRGPSCVWDSRPSSGPMKRMRGAVRKPRSGDLCGGNCKWVGVCVCAR
jgi:hypothetical protein